LSTAHLSPERAPRGACYKESIISFRGAYIITTDENDKLEPETERNQACNLRPANTAESLLESMDKSGQQVAGESVLGQL